ncbi:MAG TPA: divalent-cation tolerance protein CutA [Pyrinomonadaceae bacterium]|nr:divalent-cation tolerance protein CutA [Pyrinomonadaceae bacterium]
MLLVFTTVPDAEEGERLATKVVDAKLGACVQILPPMTSVYVWDGRIQKEREHLLLIKTLQEKYPDVEKFILANHSYEVPEIFAIEVSKASEGYANWLGKIVG